MAEELPDECRDYFDDEDEDTDEEAEDDGRECCACWWKGEDGECLFDGPCPGLEVR